MGKQVYEEAFDGLDGCLSGCLPALLIGALIWILISIGYETYKIENASIEPIAVIECREVK